MQVADGSLLSPSLRISSIEENHLAQDHALSQMLTGQCRSIKAWSLCLGLGQLYATISLPNTSMLPGRLGQAFLMTSFSSFCIQSSFTQFFFLNSCGLREHFLARLLHTNVYIQAYFQGT